MGEPNDHAEICLLSHDGIYSLTAASNGFYKDSERKPVYLWKEMRLIRTSTPWISSKY